MLLGQTVRVRALVVTVIVRLRPSLLVPAGLLHFVLAQRAYQHRLTVLRGLVLILATRLRLLLLVLVLVLRQRLVLRVLLF